MLARLQRLNLRQQVVSQLKSDEDILTDLNRDQLKQGRDSGGGYLIRYADDPYFKNPASVERYTRWKASLPGYDSRKPIGVADYKINGYTHGAMNTIVTDTEMKFVANVPWAGELEMKSPNYLGLTVDSKRKYKIEYLMPSVWAYIRKNTGML